MGRRRGRRLKRPIEESRLHKKGERGFVSQNPQGQMGHLLVRREKKTKPKSYNRCSPSPKNDQRRQMPK